MQIGVVIRWIGGVLWILIQVSRRPVSWCFKKQPVIALSSCEAEYVAGSLAASQANWLQ
jgi:hypothetical protein